MHYFGRLRAPETQSLQRGLNPLEGVSNHLTQLLIGFKRFSKNISKQFIENIKWCNWICIYWYVYYLSIVWINFILKLLNEQLMHFHWWKCLLKRDMMILFACNWTPFFLQVFLIHAIRSTHFVTSNIHTKTHSSWCNHLHEYAWTTTKTCTKIVT